HFAIAHGNQILVLESQFEGRSCIGVDAFRTGLSLGKAGFGPAFHVNYLSCEDEVALQAVGDRGHRVAMGGSRLTQAATELLGKPDRSWDDRLLQLLSREHVEGDAGG